MRVMRTQRAVFKIFSILAITFFPVQTVFAGDNAGFVSSLKDGNNGILERSDVRVAVGHFCRALSIDSQDKTIEENLEAIISYPELTAAQRSDVLLLEDQLSYIENMQGRVKYLISKRNLLRDQLIESGHESDVLLKGLFGIKNNMSGSHEVFSYQKQFLLNRKNPLAIINNLLAREKVQLSIQVRSLQNQYNWLKAVNKNEHYLPSRHFMESVEMPVFVSLEESDRVSSPKASISAVEQKRADAMAQASQVGKEADDQEKTIGETISSYLPGAKEKTADEKTTEKFKKELGALYVQLDKIEERIGKEDGKISELEKQVVDLSLRLSETEIRLNKKAEAVDSLTAQLTDVEQRFVLGQRIIQEKNEEMQSLQEDLQKLHLEDESFSTKYSDRITAKDQELVKLKTSLSEANKQKKKLNDSLALKDRRLAELEDFINELENARLVTEKESQRVDVLFAQKNKELKVLDGFLHIYRQGLGDANRVIKQKDRQLAALERKFKKLRYQLVLKKREHQKKDYQGRLFEKTLYHEKEKKEQRNINLRKVILQKDREIDQLKGKLAGAQRNLQAVSRVVEKKVARLKYAKNELAALREQLEPDEKEVQLEKIKYRAFPDRKLTELNGILKIYKEKPFEETKSTQAKTADITSLEKQLALLENQLNEKNKALVKTQRDLHDLEGRLTVMKQELLELRERPEDDGSQDSDDEGQVQELQSKFRDINDFLLENLYDFDKIKVHRAVQ